MWKKVSAESQLQVIKIGTVLLKYPVLDDPLQTFDEATPENVALRIVSRNDSELQEIDFVLAEQKIKDEIITGLNNIIFSPIKKTYKDVIENGRYWLNE